jgi:hypothetical protein
LLERRRIHPEVNHGHAACTIDRALPRGAERRPRTPRRRRHPAFTFPANDPPTCVRQTFPKRLRSDDGWAEETRLPPLLDEELGGDRDERERLPMHHWSAVRSYFGFPVIILGEAGSDDGVLTALLGAHDDTRERDPSVRDVVADALRAGARRDDGLRRRLAGKLTPGEPTIETSWERFRLTMDCTACGAQRAR